MDPLCCFVLCLALGVFVSLWLCVVLYLFDALHVCVLFPELCCVCSTGSLNATLINVCHFARLCVCVFA